MKRGFDALDAVELLVGEFEVHGVAVLIRQSRRASEQQPGDFDIRFQQIEPDDRRLRVQAVSHEAALAATAGHVEHAVTLTDLQETEAFLDEAALRLLQIDDEVQKGERATEAEVAQ